MFELVWLMWLVSTSSSGCEEVLVSTGVADAGVAGVELMWLECEYQQLWLWGRVSEGRSGRCWCGRSVSTSSSGCEEVLVSAGVWQKLVWQECGRCWCACEEVLVSARVWQKLVCLWGSVGECKSVADAGCWCGFTVAIPNSRDHLWMSLARLGLDAQVYRQVQLSKEIPPCLNDSSGVSFSRLTVPWAYMGRGNGGNTVNERW